MKSSHIVPAMAVLALLSCQSVQAGDRQSSLVGPPAPKDYSRAFFPGDKPHVNPGKALLFHGGDALVDILTTGAFQKRGVSEDNGIVRTWGLTQVKVGVGLFLSGLDMLAQRYAPELVKPLRVFAKVFHLSLGIYNHTAGK